MQLTLRLDVSSGFRFRLAVLVRQRQTLMDGRGVGEALVLTPR